MSCICVVQTHLKQRLTHPPALVLLMHVEVQHAQRLNLCYSAIGLQGAATRTCQTLAGDWLWSVHAKLISVTNNTMPSV